MLRQSDRENEREKSAKRIQAGRQRESEATRGGGRAREHKGERARKRTSNKARKRESTRVRK